MDVGPANTISVEERDETNPIATQIEATTSKLKDENLVIENPEICSDTKYEDLSTSCPRAENDKPKVEETENIAKENPQPCRNTESPEPSCSICLGKMENKSFTNSCFHQFCFSCLLEWSKVKPECPLCKQPFKSIVHNVRSMEDYDQYHLRLDDLNAWENRDGRRFRYRSTLTSERRRELALGRFLMSQRMPSRSLEQPRSNGRHLQTSSDYRRHVYDSGLYVRMQPAGRSSRYRETSPAFFTQNPACTHRLIPWLNRELNALEYGHQTAFLMELILSLIQRFHIQSPEFRELVQPYFLGYTRHFIHEFYNFARSPHDMVDYDRRVSYVDDLPQMVDSDSDSDIIVLSPDRASRPRWSQRPLQSSPRTLSTSRDHTAVLDRAKDFLESVAMFGSLASTSWSSDHRPSTSATPLPSTSTSTVASPEPGPSGMQQLNRRESRRSSRLRSVVTVPNSNPQEVKTELTIAEEDGSDDDCMIVGYEEPCSQHSPLDVIVLSDSDDDVIIDTPMLAEVTPESVKVVAAPQLPMAASTAHESSESESASQSGSLVRAIKITKHHKRAKAKSRRSRSTSRPKSSPSRQSSSSHSRHRHHDKRSRKKQSSKSSGRSKSPSTQHDEDSTEHGRPHKSSKKKHSRKHKRSKSREHKTSSSS